MRLLAAFVAHEARTQFRSLRFRVLALVYAALVSTLPVVLFLVRKRAGVWIGPSTYAHHAFALAPVLTAIVSAVLSVDAISRERDEGSLAVVGVAPMTNAGYLFRRWFSILAILLPLTMIGPVVAAGLAIAAGTPPTSAGSLIWPWMLHVVPICIASSAFGLGLGTITGGTVVAAVTGGLFFLLVLGLGNDLMDRLHLHLVLSGPGEWIGSIERVFDIPDHISWIFNGNYGVRPATEAPYDVRAALEWLWPRAAFGIGMAAVSLGFSVVFLRRTRPDLRPWPLRADHPLRTYHKLANRLREEYMPDPASTTAELICIAGGLAVLLGGMTLVYKRDANFRSLASRRYAPEVAGEPAPTPASLVAVNWSIRGSLQRNGEVRTETVTTIKNEGESPETHLAFSVNPHLEVQSLQIEGGKVRLSRAWDRLCVEVDPPIGKGETRRLEARLAGVPQEEIIRFPTPGGFVPGYRNFLRGDVVDFSRAESIRAISARRAALDAVDLTPQLRYSSWAIPAFAGEPGSPENVPPETAFLPVDLSIDLTGPRGLLLADSCGDVSRTERDSSRLAGRCQVPLSNFVVRGGRLAILDGTQGLAALAVLPAHAEVIRKNLSVFAAASDAARRAWPGIDPFPSSVFIETPPPFDMDLTSGMHSASSHYYENRDAGIRSWGSLVEIEESQFLQNEPMTPENLAIPALVSTLVRRRPVAVAEQLFFRHLFRTMALARLGKERAAGAVISAPERPLPTPLGRHDQRIPMLKATGWDWLTWNQRLPSILIDLQTRTSERAIFDSIEEFLAVKGTEGTAKELVDRISKHSGVSLERIYSDYFLADALPELALENVKFERRENEWVVTGSVRNLGSGESFCPVVLRTDFDAPSMTVRVDTRSATPFVLKSRSRPRDITLDPDRRCYRNLPAGTTVRVEYRGGGS